MSNRQWEEVSGGSNNERWEPQKQNYDPNNPPVLLGYFRKMRVQTGGQNGPFSVCEIALVNEQGQIYKCLDLSGGKVMEDKMNDITVGSFVCIKYLGKTPPKKASGNHYNNWAVFVDKGAIPMQNVAFAPEFQQNQSTAQNNTTQSTNTQAANNTNQQQNNFGAGNQQQNNANFGGGQNNFNTNPQNNTGGNQQNNFNQQNNNQQNNAGGNFGGGQQFEKKDLPF